MMEISISNILYNNLEFEKSIVPWSDDSECISCRICNTKFSITRRKHHCRLCGKIMCNNCSRFLSHISASKFFLIKLYYFMTIEV